MLILSSGFRRNPSMLMRFCSSSSSAGTPSNTVKEANVLIPAEIQAVFSLNNASRKQVLQQKVAAAKDAFKTHKTDTGSPQVQSKSVVNPVVSSNICAFSNICACTRILCSCYIDGAYCLACGALCYP